MSDRRKLHIGMNSHLLFGDEIEKRFTLTQMVSHIGHHRAVYKEELQTQLRVLELKLELMTSLQTDIHLNLISTVNFEPKLLTIPTQVWHINQ